MIFIATCGIWKISSNLKQVINYISNEEKTIKQNDFIIMAEEIAKFERIVKSI